MSQGSLFDHLHVKHTNFTEEMLLNISEDIALGMCYLHGRGVFHCDLKSSNILVKILYFFEKKL
jgi:serine/threonine protein kinase